MIVPVTHILPLTEVRRSRMLSGRGEVLRGWLPLPL